MMYGDNGMWGFWVFGLLMVVGVVLLGVVIARALGGGFTTRGHSGIQPPSGDQLAAGRNRAREILDERYARGDLTTEEYQERLHALGGG